MTRWSRAFERVERRARGDVDAHLLRIRHAGGAASLFADARRRCRDAGGRPRRPARRRQHHRRRRARSSTSVDLDHQDYLGDTREAIGFEKAGIFRAGAAGDLRRCRSAGSPGRARARDRRGSVAASAAISATWPSDSQWRYWGPRGKRHGLPLSGLARRPSCQRRRRADRARVLARAAAGRRAQDMRGGLLHAELPGASRCCRAGRM